MATCVDQHYPETQLFRAKELSIIVKSESVEKERSKSSDRNSAGELMIGVISWCKDSYTCIRVYMCIFLCTGEAWVRGYNVAVAGLNFVKECGIFIGFSIPLIILSTERAWKKLRRSWFAPS